MILFILTFSSMVTVMLTIYIMEKQLDKRNVDTGAVDRSNFMSPFIYFKNKRSNNEPLGFVFWINIIALLVLCLCLITIFTRAIS